MANKAISTVVATIIVLMIVLALAGVAYLYLSGIFAGTMTTGFEVVFADRSTIGIKNIGTENITQLNVFVDDQEVPIEMSPIPPTTLGFVNITTPITKGTHSFVIKSSSTVQRFPVVVIESITDISICQIADDAELCDGLDIFPGEGYKYACCVEHGLCCET